VPNQRDDAGSSHFTARVLSIAIPSVFKGKARYLVISVKLPSRKLRKKTHGTLSPSHVL